MKAYEKNLVDRALKFLELHGSRKSRSAVDNAMLILMASEIVVLRGGKLLGTFLDERKCYPTAFRDGIMFTLANSWVQGDIWHALDRMQENLKCRVRINKVLSDWFELKIGLLEGAGASPVKYSNFAEMLASQLRSMKLGLTLKLANGEDIWLGMLGFVDDKALLATSFEEMQEMLDVVARVARAQVTTYTLPKSVFIQFVGAYPSRREEVSLRLKGMKGDGVDLGHQQVRNQSKLDVRGGPIID
jgi:hypothetical protein